jgi:hypothetical protein
MNTAKQSMGSAGIQTAALGFGGQDIPGSIAATEEYDGTSWSNSPGSLNTARTALGGFGTTAAALAFGGGPPSTGATEEWTGAGSPTTVTITAS